ncbi:MAG TPA: phosphoribosylglycinamide synthetase C domain-containing protein, partial [Pyrinomonadaceae bacterium]
IVEKIVEPTLKGCREEGFEFRGILFLGLMMTASGAQLLEYNVRFGDPETQAILVRLKTDFLEICEAIHAQTLGKIEIEWLPGSSACVVLASKGYPAKAQTGDSIHGLGEAGEDETVVVFHAGTAKNENGEFVTAGGRVLSVTATAENLPEALNRAYKAVEKINWDGMQFRRDIGKK